MTGQIEQLKFLYGATSEFATPIPFNHPIRVDTRTMGILVRNIGGAGCAFVAIDGEWQRGASPATATTCALGYRVNLANRTFEVQLANAEAMLKHRPFAAAPSGAEGQMYGPPVPARTWAGF